ncbi:hypothetical protein EJ06DRAFT_580519 [Trichodelitschia bisporula]|uniref:Uncharacterized protein n=1 Tax=Trichodelitschia bisporula TaxID=703511 RepID=A0A6G1I2L9_9PEZI|nr:hypothetical protein EJ06DRAFT_580519 [Trichodelitschia bisporula]
MAAYSRPTRLGNGNGNDRRNTTALPATSRNHDIARGLPSGACNFRDLNAGPKPPSCGCRRFWWSAEVYTQRGSASASGVKPAASSDSNPWCVCGHHACYHDMVERTSSIGASLLGGRYSISTRESLARSIVSQAEKDTSHNIGNDPQAKSARADSLAKSARSTSTAEVNTADYLPPIPSMCLLNSTDLQLPRSEEHNGLGLTISIPKAPGPGSTTSTVPDDVYLANLIAQANRDSQMPSTRHTSTGSSYIPVGRVSPDQGFMQRVMEARRALPVPVPSTETVNPLPEGASIHAPIVIEDCAQSATELATPSLAGATPEFRGLEALVHEVGGLVNALGHADDKTTVTVPPAVAQNLPRILEKLHGALNTISAHIRSTDLADVVRTLASRVDGLESTSFTSSVIVSAATVEEINERIDMLDGKVLELEEKVDDHGRTLVGGLLEDGKRRRRKGRKWTRDTEDSLLLNDSFPGLSDSDDRTEGTFLTLLERTGYEARLRSVEERVEHLDSVAGPSISAPWEIEVVLLPWGRDLRGIWFKPEDLPFRRSRNSMGDESVFTLPSDSDAGEEADRDDDDWTRTALQLNASPQKTSKSSLRPSPLRLDDESVWSERAIQEWAEAGDHALGNTWLVPKACGPKGAVYHRLQSRGFVRTVTLRGGGAKTVRDAVRRAFIDVLDLHKSSQPSLRESQMKASVFLALDGPFAPLRKIHKSSRLRFLSPAEMVSPALWNADFLASGVMMRAPGGKKRLFVTHPEAYIQPATCHRPPKQHPGWTWQRLRELPRFTPATQEIGTPSGVPEADAKEPCWAYFPSLDSPPSSLFSSFTSVQSTHSRLSVRSKEPDSVPAPNKHNSAPKLHPITPTSELPPHTPAAQAPASSPGPASRTRSRAKVRPSEDVVVIESLSAQCNMAAARGKGKARVRDVDVGSVRAKAGRKSKRRRISRSDDESGDEGERREPKEQVWGEEKEVEDIDAEEGAEEAYLAARRRFGAFTPRRSMSREVDAEAGGDAEPDAEPEDEEQGRPVSPFFVPVGSQSTGVGSAAFAASRGGMMKRGTTPFAYATPFSGPTVGPVSVRNVSGGSGSGVSGEVDRVDGSGASLFGEEADGGWSANVGDGDCDVDMSVAGPSWFDEEFPDDVFGQEQGDGLEEEAPSVTRKGRGWTQDADYGS